MKFTPRLKRAIDAAARAHAEQKRWDGSTPYISHPFGVALILSQYTNKEDVVIAGLLHDVLEDVPDRYSGEQIKSDFGSEVLNLVQNVTENTDEVDYRIRKQAYLNHLAAANEDVLMISAADLTHNIYSYMGDQLNTEVMEKFGGKRVDREWFWSERARLISQRLDNPIKDLLSETYQKYLDTQKAPD